MANSLDQDQAAHYVRPDLAPSCGYNSSKACLKWPLKKDKTKVIKKNGSLMKVKSIAECSHLEYSAILLTCIKR